jgi:hypothetical protein
MHSSAPVSPATKAAPAPEATASPSGQDVLYVYLTSSAQSPIMVPFATIGSISPLSPAHEAVTKVVSLLDRQRGYTLETCSFASDR